MPALPPVEPLESVCVLRLSALGDVCHALAIVRTIQDAWPRTRITWLIARLEHKILKNAQKVEKKKDAQQMSVL